MEGEEGEATILDGFLNFVVAGEMAWLFTRGYSLVWVDGYGYGYGSGTIQKGLLIATNSTVM